MPPSSERIARVAAWGRLCGREGVKDYGDLFGMFQHFRPDGKGVEAVFAGFPHGAEMLSRLMEVYRCTSKGFRESDAYFIPRPSRACPEKKARELLAAHFDAMRKLAPAVRIEGLDEALAYVEFERVTTHEALEAVPYSDDCPESSIYEMCTDLPRRMKSQDETLRDLREALYSIACDYYLADYVRWPLYEPIDAHPDPYRAYFELWSRGVQFNYRELGACKFYITPGGLSRTS